MIKISCGEAVHYKTLKDGTLKYQKKPVTTPVWRLAIEVDGDALYGRFFSNQPSDTEIQAALRLVINAPGQAHVTEPDSRALIASAFGRNFPLVAEFLQDNGLEVYIPNGSHGGLATVARRWDRFIETVQFSMNTISEADLTLQETLDLAANSAGLIGPIARNEETAASSVLAKQICKARGRDPDMGAQRWGSSGFGMTFNTSKKVAEEVDFLRQTLEKYAPDNVPAGYELTPRSQAIYEMVECLWDMFRTEDQDVARAARLRLVQSLLNQQLVVPAIGDDNRYNRDESLRPYGDPMWELRHALGFASREAKALDECLADVIRTPFLLQGERACAFFWLPLQYTFLNGLEKKRKLFYFPWREITEWQLLRCLPPNSTLVLSDQLHTDPGVTQSEVAMGRNLLKAAVGRYPYAREKGMRTSISVKAGQDKPNGQRFVLGLVLGPAGTSQLPEWQDPPLPRLVEAAEQVNEKMRKTLDGFELQFVEPQWLYAAGREVDQPSAGGTT